MSETDLELQTAHIIPAHGEVQASSAPAKHDMGDLVWLSQQLHEAVSLMTLTALMTLRRPKLKDNLSVSSQTLYWEKKA
jgi:hypothetical protein